MKKEEIKEWLKKEFEEEVIYHKGDFVSVLNNIHATNLKLLKFCKEQHLMIQLDAFSDFN